MAKIPRLPSDIPIRDFITAVGSAEEVHGTVSTAAVAGGLGTSLVLRVAARADSSSDSTQARTTLKETATALAALQTQLIETIETETALRIFAARNLPQRSEAQRSERQVALQVALRAAADVPLEVMRLCARGLALAEAVATCCGRRGAADIELGAALLDASLRGARANLEAKLPGLTDAAYLASVVEEIARLSDEASNAVRAVESMVQVPPA